MIEDLNRMAALGELVIRRAPAWEGAGSFLRTSKSLITWLIGRTNPARITILDKKVLIID